MKINSRDIEELNPVVQKMCMDFLAECKAEGIQVLITSTFRNAESQNDLYAQGRTKPGKIVTNAKAGYSWHNFRCAFDFAPLTNGKIDWNNTKLFKRCGEIGKRCGLEWGGDWDNFKDLPHLQYSIDKSLYHLRAIHGDEAKRTW